MSTRKELELRVEELLASEARLVARVAELEFIVGHECLHRIYGMIRGIDGPGTPEPSRPVGPLPPPRE